jgi:hypothetical protein
MKHQMSWLDILRFYLAVAPFDCFSLVLIDVVYCLESGPSMMSFVILQPSSSYVEAKVLIEPLLDSSGVIASSPNRSLNGVNPVDLEMEVLWFHTTFISSSGHFPLGWMKIDFIIPVIMILFALSTNPFDSGCLTDAKCIFVAIWSQKVLNVSASN